MRLPAYHIRRRITSTCVSRCTVSAAPVTLFAFAISLCVPDGLSSLTALLEALKNLDDLYVTIDEAYTHSMQNDQYERWDEKS